MCKLISIIVPVYNADKYLERCIMSLIKQNYRNVEIILINDGSTDKSGEICDKFSKIDNRIKVIHKNNGGVSKARNDGLIHAKGDFIAFCDADDWIERDMYEILVNRMNDDGSQIAFCKYTVENLESNNEEFETKLIDYESALELIMRDDNKYGGYMCNKLISKEVIYGEKLQLFNEDIYILEDQLFLVNCVLKCKKVSIIEKELYHYEQNENSALNSKMSKKSISQIKARELIYSELKYREVNEDLLYLSWSQLIKSCSLILKKIVFNNIVENKNKYIIDIKEIMNQYKNDFIFRSDFYIKDKLYYYLTYIYF